MIPRVRKLSSFTKSIRTLWCGILLRLKPAPTFSRQKLWKLHFRSRSTQGGLAKNHFWLVATRKKRIREQPNYFWNMSLKPFSWAKNKGKLFLDEKSRRLLLARAALKFAIVEKKSSTFSTLVEPYRPKVPPMIRTLSINRLKHHLPKWKAISLFLPPTIFAKTSYLSHYMQKKRVVWHPKERLPIKLAVIRSENISVYTSFNNSIHRSGKVERTRHRCAHYFKRQDVTKHHICRMTR